MSDQILTNTYNNSWEKWYNVQVFYKMVSENVPTTPSVPQSASSPSFPSNISQSNNNYAFMPTIPQTYEGSSGAQSFHKPSQRDDFSSNILRPTTLVDEKPSITTSPFAGGPISPLGVSAPANLSSLPTQPPLRLLQGGSSSSSVASGISRGRPIPPVTITTSPFENGFTSPFWVRVEDHSSIRIPGATTYTSPFGSGSLSPVGVSAPANLSSLPTQPPLRLPQCVSSSSPVASGISRERPISLVTITTSPFLASAKATSNSSPSPQSPVPDIIPFRPQWVMGSRADDYASLKTKDKGMSQD